MECYLLQKHDSLTDSSYIIVFFINTFPDFCTEKEFGLKKRWSLLTPFCGGLSQFLGVM